MCETARDKRVFAPKVGRPKNDAVQGLPSPGPVKICKRCHQPIGKGVGHPQPCGIMDRRENISQAISVDPRAAEVLA